MAAASSGRIFVIDTSSIIEARQDTKYFRELTTVAEKGVLVFPGQVFKELERGHNPKSEKVDRPFQWISKHKGLASDPSLLTVKAILARVPRVLDPDKAGVDEADPYVLALAKELAEKGLTVTIVTEDRRDKPTKMSLATAAGIIGIPSVPLAALSQIIG